MSRATTLIKHKISVRKFMLYWAPVVVYMGCMTYVSSLSSPEEQFPTFALPVGDKIIHAFEYAILGILSLRAFENAAGLLGERYAFYFAVLTATLFGISDELHQSYVPLRHADPFDILADFVGATLGILFWQRIRSDTPEHDRKIDSGPTD